MSNIKTITPGSVPELLKNGQCQLIDVRTPVEFAAAHVRGSVNIPLDILTTDASAVAPGQGSVFLLCQSGKRACSAAELLVSETEREAIVVEGGLNQWITEGLAVDRNVKVMSLERQVRIASGLLVVLGVVLGFFVDQALFGLSAFVGAGLVYAGITDTCGMGLMLARMPWNKKKG